MSYDANYIRSQIAQGIYPPAEITANDGTRFGPQGEIGPSDASAGQSTYHSASAGMYDADTIRAQIAQGQYPQGPITASDGTQFGPEGEIHASQDTSGQQYGGHSSSMYDADYIRSQIAQGIYPPQEITANDGTRFGPQGEMGPADASNSGHYEADYQQGGQYYQGDGSGYQQ